MNKKIAISVVISLLMANTAFAEYSFIDPSDFTGDAFFSSPVITNEPEEKQNAVDRTPTMPPVKKARLLLKKKLKERDAKKTQLAPVAPEGDIYDAGAETSEFVSKEQEANFDENMMPDGFEADEEAVTEHKKSKHFWNRKDKKEKNKQPENTENIVLDCENINYDTDTYCIVATGNVIVTFVKQQTVVKADKITYDRANNTIKADGNVKIIKNGQVVTGDYIFVDMNEENALIENPVTTTATLDIKAKKGYVYGDKIVQEDGSMSVDESFPINFRSAKRGPYMSQMMLPKDETLTEDLDKGLIKVKVKDMKISQKGDMEILTIKQATVFKGGRKVVKIPALKVYTNKNYDYAETNSWELGSYRGLGMFIGPGFVFELPKSSVLKVVPFLNYYSGFGVGGLGRFQSGTNKTQVAYGTALSKFLVRGKQRLDDNLYLQYGVNDYMNEWFLGRRRPKYGIDLVYEKTYGSKDFLLKGRSSSFAHRVDLGYYHDIDEDSHFRKLNGTQIGTTRARYMAQVEQNIWRHRNKDKQTEFRFDIASQFAATLYGTGDTQVIGRLGPRLHTQYKRWMQDIGYFQSVYDDNSPIPVFDAYRYGKSNLYLREYLRLNRYLTLSWFGSINLSGDSPNDKAFQENAFYISIGPDDLKFHIGYDLIRENTYFSVEVMMDAKGTHVDYDKLEIKQDKKAQKKEEIKEEDEFQEAKPAPVLKRAVVEQIKTVEDVL